MLERVWVLYRNCRVRHKTYGESHSTGSSDFSFFVFVLTFVKTPDLLSLISFCIKFSNTGPAAAECLLNLIPAALLGPRIKTNMFDTRPMENWIRQAHPISVCLLPDAYWIIWFIICDLDRAFQRVCRRLWPTIWRKLSLGQGFFQG